MTASSAGNVTARDRLAVLQAIMLAAFAVMPGFLIGALAPRIRADFAFGPAGLGLAVACFFAAAAIGAPVLGRLADRLESRDALAIGALASAAALLGIAAAPRYAWLLVALTVGGLANAFSQPAVNASLSRSIPARHLGLAIGIKQAAIPASVLLGGLAVPTLGVTLGWRGTAVAAGIVAAAGGAVVRATGQRHPRAVHRRPGGIRKPQPELRSLVILTIGGAFSAAAATSLGAFLLDAAVVGGTSEVRAALITVGASACGLLARVGLGWWVDRHPTQSRYGTITVLLLLGAPGFLLLASGSPVAYLVGALLGFVGSWGWPGLFHYTVVSHNPETPATSTGVIQTGLSFGAGFGPVLLGNVAERTSYPTAWVVAGGLSLVGALFFAIGRHHLLRSLLTTARPTQAPLLPGGVRWDESRARQLAAGVSANHHETAGLEVTLLRVTPGGRWRARSYPDGAIFSVVEGGQVDVTIGGVRHHKANGEALVLPPNLVWTARNGGGGDVLLAILRGQPTYTTNRKESSR